MCLFSKFVQLFFWPAKQISSLIDIPTAGEQQLKLSGTSTVTSSDFEDFNEHLLKSKNTQATNHDVTETADIHQNKNSIGLQIQIADHADHSSNKNHSTGSMNITKLCSRQDTDKCHNWKETTDVSDTGEKLPSVVRRSIQLFDKPNVIETSLPRYQNKVMPHVTKKSARRRRGAHVNATKLILDQKLKFRKNHEPSRKSSAVKLQFSQVFSDSTAKDDQKNSSDVFYTPRNTFDESSWETSVDKSSSNYKLLTRDELPEEHKSKVAVTERSVCKRRKPKGTKSSTKATPDYLGHYVAQNKKNVWSALLEVNRLLEERNRLMFMERLLDLAETEETVLKVPNEEPTRENSGKFSCDGKGKKNFHKVPRVYGGGWECHRCGRSVYHAERMLACGNAYHKTCFSCFGCKKLLGPMTYLEADMEIYCKYCLRKKFGATAYGYGMGAGDFLVS